MEKKSIQTKISKVNVNKNRSIILNSEEILFITGITTVRLRYQDKCFHNVSIRNLNFTGENVNLDQYNQYI